MSLDHYIPELSESSRRWVRFAGLLVAVALLCWFAYILRAVFTPLLVALALAYMLNPLVTWLERRRKIQRLHTVVVVYVLLLLIVVGGGLVAGVRMIGQVELFARQVPQYVEAVGTWIGAVRPTPSTEPNVPEETWWEYAAPIVQEHGVALARRALNWLVGATSNVASWLSLLVLVPLYTFFFLLQFNEIVRTIREHLPAAYRGHVVYMVRTIDAAIANFFRGRLIVCMAVGVLTAIGWTLAGVPYSLPLGLLAGALNLIPFMSILCLPPALFFAYVGAADAGLPWFWPVVMVGVVYGIVQAIESFLLSPLIEGQSSGLHPLAIVVAIMVGGQLAGLLGMLLAIPVASTLKAFAAELVLPEIRRLAAGPEPDQDSEGQPELSDARHANGKSETPDQKGAS